MTVKQHLRDRRARKAQREVPKSEPVDTVGVSAFVPEPIVEKPKKKKKAKKKKE